MQKQAEIKDLIDKKGVKKTKIAEHLKMTRQGLDYQLNEAEEIDEEIYNKIKAFLGVEAKRSLANLDNQAPLFFLDEKIVPVPVYERVNAGSLSPSFVSEPVESIYLPSNGINRFALKVKGDSMEPTIKEGEIIVVDPDIEPLSGDVCLVAIEGFEYTLKRIHFEIDEVILISDNSSVYDKKIFPKSMVLQAFPVVMHIKKRDQIRRK